MKEITPTEASFTGNLTQSLLEGEDLRKIADLTIAARADGVDLEVIKQITAIMSLVFRAIGDESKEDRLLELQDLLHGFCAPGMRID